MKQLKELKTGWFVRDEETQLSLKFSDNEGDGELSIFFNAFVPLGSEVKFAPDARSGWHVETTGSGGYYAPRFRGAMVLSGVGSMETTSVHEYVAQIEDRASVYAGIHVVEGVSEPTTIAFVSEFYVVEVECSSYAFFAVELFD